MPQPAPDPILIEVLSQDVAQPHRIRLQLPDGSTFSASLPLEATLARLRALGEAWETGDPSLYGQELFSSLFPPPLDFHMGAALGASAQRGARILLQLDELSPGLHTIPWERLYIPQGNAWIPMTAAPHVTFARYLPMGTGWGLPLTTGPLRMLTVISNPFPLGHALYAEPNAERLAIGIIVDHSKNVINDFLDGPVSVDALVNRLDDGCGYDILHYIGHGAWNADAQEAYLALAETQAGEIRPCWVPGQEIMERLRLIRHLPQLVCLSVCQSAQHSSVDAFLGFGPQLVLAGCPAVICMQDTIEADAARAFMQRFFAGLLECGVVDLAVGKARQATLENWGWQWAVPVLFMRLPNGILFRPQQRLAPLRREPYRGLDAYRREDQDLFFGRSDEIARIGRGVDESQITVVYGTHDSGLTSLLQAGMRPWLERQSDWVISVAAHADWAAAVREALVLDDRPLRIRVPGDAPLQDVLRAALAECPTKRRMILFLDQFEQFFELPPDQQRAAFYCLGASLTAVGADLRLVIAVREDCFAALAELLKSEAHLSWTSTRIKFLSRDAAEQAIIEPLKRLDWPVTLHPLTLARESIVPDLEEISREPPDVDPGTLQVVCNWLYQEALKPDRAHAISEELYQAGKGAAGILERHAETILAELGSDREVAERLLANAAVAGINTWVGVEEAQLAASAIKRLDVLERLMAADLLEERRTDSGLEYTLTNHSIERLAERFGSSEGLRRAQQEVERIWSAWLARDVWATQGQLRYLHHLIEEGARPQLLPVQALLLLCSAAVRDDVTAIWLPRLRESGGADLVHQLEGCPQLGTETPASHSALDRAEQMLELLPGNPPPQPPGLGSSFGRIAWSAVAAAHPLARRKCAVALASLAPPDAVNRVQWALRAGGQDRKHHRRRVELCATLVEADERFNVMLASLTLPERIGVWSQRVQRRMARNGQVLLALTAAGAIGAAIGLGLWRAAVALLLHSGFSAGVDLQGGAWSGLLLGGALTFGMLAAEILQVADLLSPPEPVLPAPHSPESQGPRWALRLGLPAALYCALWLLLMVLNGYTLANLPIVLGAGLGTGAALAAALAGQPAKGWRLPLREWVARLGVVAIVFAGAQLIVMYLAVGNGSLWLALPALNFYADFPFLTEVTRAWAEQNRLFTLMSVGDAVLTGTILAVGTTCGLLIAANRLKRWRDLKSRISD